MVRMLAGMVDLSTQAGHLTLGGYEMGEQGDRE